MFILKDQERLLAPIYDAPSGVTCGIYYRRPRPSECIAYQSSLMKRKGDKIQDNTYKTRLEFGLKIITGIREGDYGTEDGQPISSDPQSPHFREDWKELIARVAHLHVVAVAALAFEGVAARGKTGVEFEVETGEGADEILPFGRNSQDS
jgi:hypothetical protein